MRRSLFVACALVMIAEIALPQSRPPSRRERVRRVSAGEVARDSAARDTLRSSVDASPLAASRVHRLASARTQIAANRDQRLRIVISIEERQLWALIGSDTLLDAPVAVNSEEILRYAGKTWRFVTPRGMRRVVDKRENPVWVPPDWHYAEVAREHSLGLAPMKAKRTVLSTGNWLEVRDSVVGLVDASTKEFGELPIDEEIVFDGKLFIPPVGTLNRRIEGELGFHAIDTGNGILLHGTPHKASIGTAATHGCIRLRDDDIAWLHEMIPIGTPVYIY